MKMSIIKAVETSLDALKAEYYEVLNQNILKKNEILELKNLLLDKEKLLFDKDKVINEKKVDLITLKESESRSLDIISKLKKQLESFKVENDRLFACLSYIKKSENFKSGKVEDIISSFSKKRKASASLLTEENLNMKSESAGSVNSSPHTNSSTISLSKKTKKSISPNKKLKTNVNLLQLNIIENFNSPSKENTLQIISDKDHSDEIFVSNKYSARKKNSVTPKKKKFLQERQFDQEKLLKKAVNFDEVALNKNKPTIANNVESKIAESSALHENVSSKKINDEKLRNNFSFKEEKQITTPKSSNSKFETSSRYTISDVHLKEKDDLIINGSGLENWRDDVLVNDTEVGTTLDSITRLKSNEVSPSSQQHRVFSGENVVSSKNARRQNFSPGKSKVNNYKNQTDVRLDVLSSPLKINSKNEEVNYKLKNETLSNNCGDSSAISFEIATEVCPKKNKSKEENCQRFLEEKINEAMDSKYKSDFESIKKNNSDINYKYKEVVRGKDERKKLHGKDCECCSNYYKSTIDLPPLKEMGGYTSKDSRIQTNSRHRGEERMASPPGYWEPEFPSTQEVKKLKEEGKARNRNKK